MNFFHTVDPLKTGTLLDKQKSPSYRESTLVEEIFDKNPLLGHRKESFLWNSSLKEMVWCI